MTTATKYSIQIEAALYNLAAIRDFIEAAALAFGFEPDTVSSMILAADEAASNIVLHGYQNAPGEIDVEIIRRGDALIVILRDTAPAYNPLTALEPDISIPPEERMLGGMGVYMMRRAVDKMEYQALRGGGNELTLIKHINN